MDEVGRRFLSRRPRAEWLLLARHLRATIRLGSTAESVLEVLDALALAGSTATVSSASLAMVRRKPGRALVDDGLDLWLLAIAKKNLARGYRTVGKGMPLTTLEVPTMEPLGFGVGYDAIRNAILLFDSRNMAGGSNEAAASGVAWFDAFASEMDVEHGDFVIGAFDLRHSIDIASHLPSDRSPLVLQALRPGVLGRDELESTEPSERERWVLSVLRDLDALVPVGSRRRVELCRWGYVIRDERRGRRAS